MEIIQKAGKAGKTQLFLWFSLKKYGKAGKTQLLFWCSLKKAGQAVKTPIFLCFILKQAGKAAENNGFGSQEDHFENQKGHQTYTLDPCYGFI